jgi:hypothetical protein
LNGVNEVFQSKEWFSQGYLYIWWNLKAYGGNIWDIPCHVTNFTYLEHNAYLHKIVYSGY